jgi:hypothetical protein
VPADTESLHCHEAGIALDLVHAELDSRPKRFFHPALHLTLGLGLENGAHLKHRPVRKALLGVHRIVAGAKTLMRAIFVGLFADGIANLVLRAFAVMTPVIGLVVAYNVGAGLLALGRSHAAFRSTWNSNHCATTRTCN